MLSSKSSSYVCAGANILAVCGEDTSGAVGEFKSSWVGGKPNVKAIVETFFDIEKGAFQDLMMTNHGMR